MYSNEEIFTAVMQLSQTVGIPFYFSNLVTNEQEFKEYARFHDGEGDWITPDWTQEQPYTWESVVEIIDNVKEQLSKEKCKVEAKRLLSESDWAVLPDAAAALDNPHDWVMYRAALRALVASPVAGHIFENPPRVSWNI